MDNVAFGQDDFDLLANEWEEQELLDFGNDPSRSIAN